MSDQAMPGFACVGEAVDLWPDAGELSYPEANAEGRERANQLIEIIHRTDAPGLFGHVVDAMIQRGHFGGVEIGFFHAISLELMQAPVREFVEVPAEQYHSTGRKMGCLKIVA